MTLIEHLRDQFIQTHPLEVARHLEELPAQTTGEILKTMEPERAAQILEYFLTSTTAKILHQYPPTTSADILNRLSTRTTRAVLRQLDSPTQERLLKLLEPQAAALLRRTIYLPEHTAGNLADPHVLTLPSDITVAKALQRIAQVTNHAIYYLYIIDRRNVLCGVVLMKELLAAEPTCTLQAIMNPKVKGIPASANAEDAILHPAWAHYDSLPVFDSDKTFIGVLRHRTLRKFLQSTPDDPRSEFLSDALLQLWEAYSLSGIGLMTVLGDVVDASSAKFPSQEKQEIL